VAAPKTSDKGCKLRAVGGRLSATGKGFECRRSAPLNAGRTEFRASHFGWILGDVGMQSRVPAAGSREPKAVSLHPPSVTSWATSCTHGPAAHQTVYP
jgi:hypothetical protein